MDLRNAIQKRAAKVAAEEDWEGSAGQREWDAANRKMLCPSCGNLIGAQENYVMEGDVPMHFECWNRLQAEQDPYWDG